MNWINTLIVGLVALFAGLYVGKRLQEPPVAPEPQIDTVWCHDTVPFEKPVPVKVRIVDSVLVPVAADTVVVNDTVFMSLPIESKIYEDSLYYAVVSGYRPSLDTLKVVNTTRYVTTVQPVYVRKRWGVGVSAGYGAAAHDGTVYLSPYVGVGVHYNLFSF